MMKLSKKKILACALAASMSWGFAYHADAATRSEIAAIHVEKAKDFKKGLEIFKRYGWSLTDEEQELVDGTHELYKKEDEEDE